MVDQPTSPLPGKAARNEQRKAFATSCNAVSVAILVAAFLQPMAAGKLAVSGFLLTATTFVALQLALHYILRQVED